MSTHHITWLLNGSSCKSRFNGRGYEQKHDFLLTKVCKAIRTFGSYGLIALHAMKNDDKQQISSLLCAFLWWHLATWRPQCCRDSQCWWCFFFLSWMVVHDGGELVSMLLLAVLHEQYLSPQLNPHIRRRVENVKDGSSVERDALHSVIGYFVGTRENWFGRVQVYGGVNVDLNYWGEAWMSVRYNISMTNPFHTLTARWGWANGLTAMFQIHPWTPTVTKEKRNYSRETIGLDFIPCAGVSYRIKLISKKASMMNLMQHMARMCSKQRRSIPLWV